jgi:hypothetical protein
MGTGNPDVAGLQVCGVCLIHGEPKCEAPVKIGAGSLTMKVGNAYKTTTDEEDPKYPKN